MGKVLQDCLWGWCLLEMGHAQWHISKELDAWLGVYYSLQLKHNPFSWHFGISSHEIRLTGWFEHGLALFNTGLVVFAAYAIFCASVLSCFFFSGQSVVSHSCHNKCFSGSLIWTNKLQQQSLLLAHPQRFQSKYSRNIPCCLIWDNVSSNFIFDGTKSGL